MRQCRVCPSCLCCYGDWFSFTGGDELVDYKFAPCGLFPVPLGRHTKAATVNKVKAKFKLLGKFMAKALMDSRMVRTFLLPHSATCVATQQRGLYLSSCDWQVLCDFPTQAQCKYCTSVAFEDMEKEICWFSQNMQVITLVVFLFSWTSPWVPCSTSGCWVRSTRWPLQTCATLTRPWRTPFTSWRSCLDRRNALRRTNHMYVNHRSRVRSHKIMFPIYRTVKSPEFKNAFGERKKKSRLWQLANTQNVDDWQSAANLWHLSETVCLLLESGCSFCPCVGTARGPRPRTKPPGDWICVLNIASCTFGWASFELICVVSCCRLQNLGAWRWTVWRWMGAPWKTWLWTSCCPGFHTSSWRKEAKTYPSRCTI